MVYDCLVFMTPILPAVELLGSDSIGKIEIIVQIMSIWLGSALCTNFYNPRSTFL